MVLLKENEICKHIDQLLINGKYDEAIPFIEEAWVKRAQRETKILGNLIRKLNALEATEKIIG